MKRREFLSISVPAFLLLANGDLLRIPESLPRQNKQKRLLRFVVASDGHYGQPNTDYINYFSTVVNRINEEHAKDPFDFCMINGDIVHDDKNHYPAAKLALDKLAMKYYVSQGNHDRVTPLEWKMVWDMPVNFDFKIKRNSFLVATTSNEKGTYLCPDLKWLDESLHKHRKQDNIFIFMHINAAGQTKHAVDCPEMFEILKKYKNVRGIFNGHDHDEDGIKTRENIPFIFDAHFGGSWGTSYRGFRVVELMKDDSILTYILNPFERINEAGIPVVHSKS